MITESAYLRSRRAARERSQNYERQALAAGSELLIPSAKGSIIDSAMGSGGGNTSLALSPGMGDYRRAARSTEAYQYFRHWVWVAISCIARRIAGQPICAGYNTGETAGGGDGKGKSDGKGSSRAGQNGANRRRFQSRKMFSWERRHLPARVAKAAAYRPDFEILTDHPALLDLEHPNHVQRRAEFISLWVANLLLTGEAYIIGGEGEDGSPEFWAIPTAWIEPQHDGGLFTGYKLKMPGSEEPIPLPPEAVARTYIPDPSNIKAATSPVWTQISAIRTDDAIQASQEDAFRRGIFPNVAIKVGQQLDENGKPTGARPVLEGHQRRQIIRAVRQVWDRSVAQGDPAVLDGLIEDVFKLHNSPQEMDWLQSGEQTKKRILSAFGLHPFLIGEPLNVGGYAQAAVIERAAAGNVFNPIADALSTTLTDFAAPMYAEPAGLQIWVDPVKADDEEMKTRRWLEGRKNGDITRDEIRGEFYNLPPLDEPEEAKIISNPAAMQSTVAVLTAVTKGDIADDSAQEVFKTFLKVDDKQAKALLGSTKEKPKPEPPPMLPGQPPQPQNGGAPEEDEGKPPAPNMDGGEEGKSFASKSNECRDPDGRFAPCGGGATTAEKPKRTSTKPSKAVMQDAKKSGHKIIDKEVQRYAEEQNEASLAKSLGGKALPDNEAADVVVELGGKTHGVELKTMVDNGHNKITMKKDAMDRKAAWERKNKAKMHTVVYDDSAVFNANGAGQHDFSKRKIFYRRGYGSFRVSGMHEVTGGMEELKNLMTMNARSLPSGAKQLWDTMQ